MSEGVCSATSCCTATRPERPSCVADGDLASASVLTGAVLDLGLDTLTNGRPAFLNVTRPLLLGKLDTLSRRR